MSTHRAGACTVSIASVSTIHAGTELLGTRQADPAPAGRWPRSAWHGESADTFRQGGRKSPTALLPSPKPACRTEGLDAKCPTFCGQLDAWAVGGCIIIQSNVDGLALRAAAAGAWAAPGGRDGVRPTAGLWQSTYGGMGPGGWSRAATRPACADGNLRVGSGLLLFRVVPKGERLCGQQPLR
eukprot:scaffold1206_cov388-Prasinococcus_capsulatus_cf.AAC.30